ncbi:MAG: LysR family transcriptional regulator [Acidimicrobiales bacterium]
MDLRQLAYVVAVVDHGGFTRAAEAVHVTQPSLSQAVKALEAELGVELFLRTGRDVVLTAAGEALLGPARQALRDAANARAAVAEVAGVRAGHLDVVCLPTLAVDPVAGLVGRFRQAHPGVTVRLAEPEDPGAVAEAVRSGASEIAVTELPPVVPAPDLVEVGLEAHDYLAVLPPAAARDHPPDRPVTLAALGRHPHHHPAGHVDAPAARRGAGRGRGRGDRRGGERPPGGHRAAGGRRRRRRAAAASGGRAGRGSGRWCAPCARA